MHSVRSGGVMAYSLMRDRPDGIASLMGLRDRSQVSAPGTMAGSDSDDSDDSDNSDDSERASFPLGDAQSAAQRLTQDTDATSTLRRSVGVIWVDWLDASRATALDAARN
ncbi:MAG: hypothetical protein HC795_10040, partial [Coleofasciculaceae cyanobacterium RL_1_1]|nr:hypothetical protein [Coleofasciculaceae cyanobacterium RL_1_1]